MYEPEQIRCIGHIINLCAQAFIIGKDAEKVCKDLETALRDGEYKKIGDLWRKRGSIGRLHNIIHYIRASPQRRNRFAKQVVGGELAKFNNLQVSLKEGGVKMSFGGGFFAPSAQSHTAHSTNY